MSKETQTEPNKKFRVTLLRGYFPQDPDFPKHPLTGSVTKATAGETIELPVEEAKRLLKERIAELPDDFEP
jgi:hypothetical protein